MITPTTKTEGDPRPDEPSPLVRPLTNVEIPAPGMWPLLPASHVAIAPRPDARPVESAVHHGHLVATPAVEDVTVCLALGAQGATLFTGAPVQVVATRFGIVEWSFEGFLADERGAAAMTLTLGYHGVYRRARKAWAWFTGSGEIDRDDATATRGQRCDVVVDLLFAAPAELADPTSSALVDQDG